MAKGKRSGRQDSERGSHRNTQGISTQSVMSYNYDRSPIVTQSDLNDLFPEKTATVRRYTPLQALRAVQYRLNVPGRAKDRILTAMTVPAFVQNNEMVKKIVCARRRVRRAVFFAKGLMNKAGYGSRSRRYAWHSKIKCK